MHTTRRRRGRKHQQNCSRTRCLEGCRPIASFPRTAPTPAAENPEAQNAGPQQRRQPARDPSSPAAKNVGRVLRKQNRRWTAPMISALWRRRASTTTTTATTTRQAVSYPIATLREGAPTGLRSPILMASVSSDGTCGTSNALERGHPGSEE